MALQFAPARRAEPDQSLSTFYRQVRDFDVSAPLGRWKLDNHLLALGERRQVQFCVVTMRRRLWRAAYVASLNDAFERNEKPVLAAEASEFVAKLQVIETALSRLRARPENLAQVLWHIPDAGRAMPSHEQHEAIEASTRALMSVLAEAEAKIRTYQHENILPRRSGRSPFIRIFAETSAIAWRSSVAPELQRKRDRGDFVGMMGAALDQFGYPRDGIQVGSDDWLYERVGKYKIWK